MKIEKYFKVRDAHDHWQNMQHTKTEITSWVDLLFPLEDGEPSETQAKDTKLSLRIEYTVEKEGQIANATKTLTLNRATGPVIRALVALFGKEEKKAYSKFKSFR